MSEAEVVITLFLFVLQMPTKHPLFLFALQLPTSNRAVLKISNHLWAEL